MSVSLPFRPLCTRCLRQGVSSSSSRSPLAFLRSYSNHYDEGQPEDFADIAGELKRRKRKADAKRRQYGATFVDHAVVTVRGGKGGSGASALAASLRGPSSPCGGNGGPGGSIYLTTSSSLTSLASLSKRLIGGQGSSGSGAFKHGRRGEDLLIKVPIGTIVREMRREGEEERMIREEEELGLDQEEKRKRKWQRWFITHPSAGGEVSTKEYAESESLMRREGRWSPRTPSFEESPPVILDLSEPVNEPILLAQGGAGGLGNPFFTSPRIASRGALPPTQTFEFELKLLADVGLVGFPNAGKSTILRALTGRKAEVAGYQFTTLNPQIGVVRVWEDGTWGGGEGIEVVEETWVEREREELERELGEVIPPESTPIPRLMGSTVSKEASDVSTSTNSSAKIERIRFTLSDNPGLLPSASQNVGLGHSFLRSIERSPVLVYVLDLTRPSPSEDLLTLQHELEAYKPGLSDRASVVVLNKGDGVDEEVGKERLEGVHKAVTDGTEVEVLSGKYGLGLEKLVELLSDRVAKARLEGPVELDELPAEVPVQEERRSRKHWSKDDGVAFGLKKFSAETGEQ
ncbi:hypothetical protein CI109_104915 [Kwoniella shandongensis]|uniref:Uncharacterized protein n=1 Tax=Kwoniella shandongensis TaxID=1734106 RepID=A0A5M6BTK3_9TREE|nr:uncharacterized protein CI109_006299 [Kwoniella shandongensis]KAA5525400.1 hypothetical protein CI109_006299 [Kwoniella shandongensis]